MYADIIKKQTIIIYIYNMVRKWWNLPYNSISWYDMIFCLALFCPVSWKVLCTFPHLDFTMCKVHQLILREKKQQNSPIWIKTNKSWGLCTQFLKKTHRWMMVRGILCRIKPAGYCLNRGRNIPHDGVVVIFLFRIISFLINWNICICRGRCCCMGDAL